MSKTLKKKKHWSTKVQECTVSWGGSGELVTVVEVRGGAELGEFPYLGHIVSEALVCHGGRFPSSGDVLLEVNGTPVSGLTNRDTLAVIRHFREPIRMKTPGQKAEVCLEWSAGSRPGDALSIQLPSCERSDEIGSNLEGTVESRSTVIADIYCSLETFVPGDSTRRVPRGTSPRHWLASVGRIFSVAVHRDLLWVGLERLGGEGGSRLRPRALQHPPARTSLFPGNVDLSATVESQLSLPPSTKIVSQSPELSNRFSSSSSRHSTIVAIKPKAFT
ncbi:Membrane-associated guanylate kinase, WW and PDZ domain-containing protein 3 [Collichthys lucidus]|uniref:Membrane-associated guanylate kinase, WW and PDZ domain-containing protein 3 n=1 Tax=Collichthys lucidus TaxID=240159 RepID=A0A4U5USR0_COLLU|nr:Membrane-associated guanylate kinase, WW and PDZ domain-containing protein 3 [Collichthys lucidus]